MSHSLKSVLSACGALILVAFFSLFQIHIPFLGEIVFGLAKISRFSLLPLVFFSLGIAVCKLKRDKILLSVLVNMIILIVSLTIGSVLLGIVSISIFTPQRLPVVMGDYATIQKFPAFSENLGYLFPKNAFHVFSYSGDFLLPLIVLSFILGLAFSVDKEVSEPTYNLFDSLSRLFYLINKFIVDYLWITIFFVTLHFAQTLQEVNLKLFAPLLITLVLLTIAVIFVVYPLIIYLILKKKNPYRWIFSIFSVLWIGLTTGDNFWGLTTLIPQGRENLGVPREIGALTYPLAGVFARAGTAMISAVTFIVILRSYSSLDLTLFQIFWVSGFSVLLSFTLVGIPYFGVLAIISQMSLMYNRGLDDAYLIISAVLPFLLGFAAMIDLVTNALITLIIAGKQGRLKKVV